jgi:amino acid permease
VTGQAYQVQSITGSFDMKDEETKTAPFSSMESYDRELGRLKSVEKQTVKSDEDIRVTILQIAVRTLLPLVAIGLSHLIPDFFKLVSLIGIVSGLSISFLLPLLCYWKIFHREITKIEQNLIIITIFVVVTLWLLSLIQADPTGRGKNSSPQISANLRDPFCLVRGDK